MSGKYVETVNIMIDNVATLMGTIAVNLGQLKTMLADSQTFSAGTALAAIIKQMQEMAWQIDTLNLLEQHGREQELLRRAECSGNRSN